ncbi:MAG: GIY-YIG nuclease family protein [Anaerolineae bacterium]|nr:GIY-YIG nuclease family protein [Anaerolineae bacterium]
MDNTTYIPADGKGTYILILHLPAKTTLQIGRLGRFEFAAGWYAYVGSAFNSGGLRGRLRHHLSPMKRPHWHIDYLRQAAVCQQVWTVASDTAYEHTWAALLSQVAKVAVPRFGASDCRCVTHLFYFETPPAVADFRALAGQKAIDCWLVKQEKQGL